MATTSLKSEPLSEENPRKNIIFIGTSHIAQESVKEVKATIAKYADAIVAVELDKNRLQALLAEDAPTSFSLADIRHVGLAGFIFGTIGAYVSKKLGKLVNQKPGADMLAAIKAAQEHGHNIALIDQNVVKTLKRFSQEITWREKGRVVKDIFLGVFFQKSQLKRVGLEQFDLTKVPPKEVIKKMMFYLKKSYPNVYKVLIEERNVVMVKRLYHLAQNHPEKTIIAVIGAGHEDGMRALLKLKPSN